ncbi:hypothetical protein GOP47_0030265 [Adiantum capillus-veneris]|nr:hypothetical protein GOP47_0030265 [Adiantum capillus-veneris]
MIDGARDDGHTMACNHPCAPLYAIGSPYPLMTFYTCSKESPRLQQSWRFPIVIFMATTLILRWPFPSADLGLFKSLSSSARPATHPSPARLGSPSSCSALQQSPLFLHLAQPSVAHHPYTLDVSAESLKPAPDPSSAYITMHELMGCSPSTCRSRPLYLDGPRLDCSRFLPAL